MEQYEGADDRTVPTFVPLHAADYVHNAMRSSLTPRMRRGTTSVGRMSVVLVLVGVLAAGVSTAGITIRRHMQSNEMCCQIPLSRNFSVSVGELLGLVTFHAQIGQDKWVSEAIFPGVTDGFFADVGSGDGTWLSNTKALEQKGWTGICIDPFPTHMQGRTCQLFRDVVFSRTGQPVIFRAAGVLGGIEDTLGRWKSETRDAETVEFTTVTLGDILARARAPQFIHFVSLDIEGAELEALQGFPFDRYRIGAIVVEHNFEEPKRTHILDLMDTHGYTRVHAWKWDDFYVPDDER